MFKALFGRFRAKRILAPPPPAETPTPLQRASVEEIWSSWRYQTPVLQPANATQPASAKLTKPRSANAAERVNQLKRAGEYDMHCRPRCPKLSGTSRKGCAGSAGIRGFPGITGRPPRFAGSSSATTKRLPWYVVSPATTIFTSGLFQNDTGRRWAPARLGLQDFSNGLKRRKLWRPVVLTTSLDGRGANRRSVMSHFAGSPACDKCELVHSPAGATSGILVMKTK
jgi:hypothetical protein